MMSIIIIMTSKIFYIKDLDTSYLQIKVFVDVDKIGEKISYFLFYLFYELCFSKCLHIFIFRIRATRAPS